MKQLGFVYIHKHKHGQTVKVGVTKRDSRARLKDYSKAYLLKGFDWHKDFDVPLNAREDIEKIAHRILQDYQLSGLEGAREIFSCTVDIAEKAVKTAIKESKIAIIEREKAEIEKRKQDKIRKQRQERDKLYEDFRARAEQDWHSSAKYTRLSRELDSLVSNPPNQKDNEYGVEIFLILAGCAFLGFYGGSFILLPGWILTIVGFSYFLRLGDSSNKMISYHEEKHKIEENLENSKKSFLDRRLKGFDSYYKKILNLRN